MTELRAFRRGDPAGAEYWRTSLGSRDTSQKERDLGELRLEESSNGTKAFRYVKFANKCRTARLVYWDTTLNNVREMPADTSKLTRLAGVVLSATQAASNFGWIQEAGPVHYRLKTDKAVRTGSNLVPDEGTAGLCRAAAAPEGVSLGRAITSDSGSFLTKGIIDISVAGAGAQTSLTTDDASALEPIGTLRFGDLGRVFKYIKFKGSTRNGSVVSYSNASNVNVGATIASARRVAGVALASHAANRYGWMQLYGPNMNRVTTGKGVTDGVIVAKSTATARMCTQSVSFAFAKRPIVLGYAMAADSGSFMAINTLFITRLG